MTTDITVAIGDAHVRPGQNLKRFKALASELKKRLDANQPIRRVISIGDFGDFDSLSAWDRDKRKRMEGRRFELDLACVEEAAGILRDGLEGLEWVYIEGNHEDRLSRYLDTDPTFEGVADIRRAITSSGWKWVPYKEAYRYRGVSFTHVPLNEMGKPIGGVNAVRKVLEVYNHSVVWGHSHKLEFGCVHRLGAPHLNQAANIGCFFDHHADYTKGSPTSYWRGVLFLDHYSQNRFDIETVATSKLLRDNP